MRIFKYTLLFMTLVALPCQAIDIKAIKTNESFQEVARIDKLEQIKINTPPRTTYTPKNLRTQYIMSFQGRDNNNTMVYWSNTFTDYDTKVMESVLEGNEYFIKDNTGAMFKTGEHVDLTPLQNDINTNKQNIQTNTQNIEINKQNIQVNKQNIQNNSNQIQNLNQKVYKQGQNISNLRHQVRDLQSEMRSGLATVTALTSLHPNPRSKAPIELSVGMGMYKDQCAGAVGLFAHPTDNFMIQGGVAFGNNDDWAGYVGVTVGIDFHRRKK
jgi:hypothetical protein